MSAGGCPDGGTLLTRLEVRWGLTGWLQKATANMFFLPKTQKTDLIFLELLPGHMESGQTDFPTQLRKGVGVKQANGSRAHLPEST